MAPASRRQVASTDTLAAFGASPIYYYPRNDEVPNAPTTTNTSSSDAQIHGVKIGGWTIRTQNSSIGDEQSMEKLTLLLEDTANTQQHLDDKNNSTKQRRLCPPEITFLDAFISFQYEFDSNHVDGDSDSDGRDVSSLELRFNAKDALSEWAEAHKSLETEPTPAYKHEVQVSLPPTQRKEYRGVSILQTQDAKVWSKKPKSVADDAKKSNSSAATQSSAFYYDWTFSSPYAGTILSNHDRANKPKALNNRQLWQPLTESHIPFHLLKDTSQPILLYDDIYFFEDDLHDNGETSLNIKIRVMPKCWYVLQRLFVRVDSVCVKCREVRYFCLVNGDDGTNAATLSCRQNTIYRDVTWREATWEKLKEMDLPLDPTAYMEQNTGASGGSFGSNCSTGIPSFAALLARLPVLSVPFDLYEHSCYEFVREH